MEELHRLTTYDILVLQSFINNQIEESLYIEYKAAGALSQQDSKKKEISKDVAAFANSDGGIIIYGMNEKHHKADSFSFIDGTLFTKEWLEQIISSTVRRNIPHLKIFPIRIEDDLQKSIYVVQIPASIEAPHMSRDKRFYKRFNFESVMMEEYEIRSLYGRKLQSKLVISGYQISMKKELNDDKVEFNCEAYLYNEGEKEEKDYKINVYLIGHKEQLGVNWEAVGPTRNQDYTILDDRIKVSASSAQTIYPNETITAVRFNFTIRKDAAVEALKTFKVKFLLFYPGGEDSMETELENIREKLALINELSEEAEYYSP